ncbi:hypothetical protein D9M69_563740 [compost metagenome]
MWRVVIASVTPLIAWNFTGLVASITVSAWKPDSFSTSSYLLGFGLAATPKVARCTKLKCELSKEFSSARIGLVCHSS